MRLGLLFKYLNYYHFSAFILQNFYFFFSFKCNPICAELSWQHQESWNMQCSVLLCDELGLQHSHTLLLSPGETRNLMMSHMDLSASFHPALSWGVQTPSTLIPYFNLSAILLGKAITKCCWSHVSKLVTVLRWEALLGHIQCGQLSEQLQRELQGQLQMWKLKCWHFS